MYSAIGKFYSVKRWIDAGAIDSALASLNTITPANLIEQNIYTTLYIYLTTYAIGLLPDSVQISALESIAAQHVMTGGPGVYNARAMLNWEQDDAGGALRLQNLNENITDNLNPQHPRFYPNPAQNSITLPYTVADNEIINVSISDMLGRVLKQIKFAAGEEIEVKLSEFNNGTFLIQLERDDALWFRDKVVVIK